MRWWPHNYDKKNTTIYTENPIRTYNQEIWCRCCHARSRPQDHRRNRTTRKSHHLKSWQRLEEAHISWPYHPQWPYTTHSISPSLNLTKTTDSPHKIKEPPPLIQIEGEDEYELDEIIDSGLHYNKLQYRAKPKGYSPKHDKVWYPAENFNHAAHTIQRFPRRYPGKPGVDTHVTINKLSAAPPPIRKQQRHSDSPESDAQRIARNANPTSPEYSGSPKREVAHVSMNWTDCTNDECQIHPGEKPGSGWYPQFTRRSRKQSVAQDHDWRQEMDANPGEDWAPQQPRRRRARRAHHEITSWEHCFNNNCNEH